MTLRRNIFKYIQQRQTGKAFAGFVCVCLFTTFFFYENLFPGGIFSSPSTGSFYSFSETDANVVNFLPNKIQFSIQPQNACMFHDVEAPAVLVIVKSYIGNFNQRLAIRSTWGSTKIKQIKTVFVVGYQENIQTVLTYESILYEDIIQGLFIDKYDNNILKTLAMYKWLSEQCVGGVHIVFCDDDFFINVYEILAYLKNSDVTFLEYSMIGHKIKWGRPKRSINSKWLVPYSEYKYLFWPPYLGGGFILTSITVVKNINFVLPYVNSISIDDAYIGIVCNLLNIRLIHESRVSFEYTDLSCMQSFFACHGYADTAKLKQSWDYTIVMKAKQKLH